MPHRVKSVCKLVYHRHICTSCRDDLVHPHLKIKVNQTPETKLKVKQVLLGLSGDESDSHSAADDLPSEDDMLSALNLWIP